jgi:hypothetical protein
MDLNEQTCHECLASASVAISARGVAICQYCAETFYVACAFCQGLIPQDESVTRDGIACCLACSTKTAPEADATPLSEEELMALVAEFVRLHAEEKKVKDRLEGIKEKLKRHAATQRHDANAVVIRAGEQAVKCSYSVRTSWNSCMLLELEQTFGAEAVAALFEREVKFSPLKDRLEEFLNTDDQTTAEMRAALRSAAENKEVATLQPVAPKKPAKKQSRTSAPAEVK